jgi:hypothetical protein
MVIFHSYVSLPEGNHHKDLSPMGTPDVGLNPSEPKGIIDPKSHGFSASFCQSQRMQPRFDMGSITHFSRKKMSLPKSHEVFRFKNLSAQVSVKSSLGFKLYGFVGPAFVGGEISSSLKFW